MTEFEDALTHYGVKGMHWGVRRAESVGPASVKVVQKKPTARAKIKTEKGAGLHPSADALKAATFRQQARKSGVQSLSNDEIKALANRLQLEKQLRDLQAPKGPRKFVADLILGAGKQQAKVIVDTKSAELVSNILRKPGK